MFVLATKDNEHIASSTKIRNFKFKTEQDGETGWFVIDGTDCWASCDEQGGRCDHCGTNGFCCSRSKYNLNGDCTEKMLIAIRESIFSENDGHMCVAKLEEESCVDWTIQPSTDCPGNDMSETWTLDDGGIDAPEGPPKCIDLCLANRPRCVGWSWANPTYSRPNRCFLKHKMQNCRAHNGLESGTLMHYDCRENHNCGGSFVQIKDAVPGNMIGQETSFCGNKKPDEFYSLGNHVQIKIEFDSTTSSTAEFRAKYKAEKCNRIHYEPNGPIISPGYLDQNLYAPNLDCLIQIKLDDNQLKIGLFFLTFELEDSTNCVSDYLRIDSNDKLCGRKLPDPYFKNSNSLDMYFHTNDRLQGKIKIIFGIKQQNTDLHFQAPTALIM